ncbi:hypothetical protein ACQBAU_16100 [Propionibacteriaceae bacterium Y2011]
MPRHAGRTTPGRSRTNRIWNRSLQLGEAIDTKKNWTRRRELIGPLLGATTTCDLVAANRAVTMDVGAPSLGLVRPTVTRVELLPGKDWSRTQLTKVERAAQGDLFTPPLNQLKPVPHRIRYHYHCESPSCDNGHKQEVLDWEVGSSGHAWQKIYGDLTGQKVLEKWESMVADTKDTYFFIGNQHQYRQSFSVLGVWWPKKT